MATHQITASQIRPGSTIILRGKIEYARVRSLMGPEDIDKLNETRRANRKPGAPFYPLDRNKPLTRLSLSNVEVVFKSPDGQPDLEEYYVYERLFQTPDKPELGNRWSIDNKGNRLPVLLKVIDGKAVQITDDDPASTMSMPTEPARDQLVTVVLNVYSSGMNANNGIGLQTIIFNGEPEWFNGGNSAVNNNALAALGITLSGPIVAQEGVVMNEPAQQVAAPVAAPVAPAVAQPVAPAAPTVPVVAAPVVQQAAPQNTVVDATSGLAMPAPVTQAVAPVAPVVPAVAQAAPNPQAAQLLNAVAQQQAPVQADPASAFGVTPEAQPQPVAPEASVDSPWAI